MKTFPKHPRQFRCDLDYEDVFVMDRHVRPDKTARWSIKLIIIKLENSRDIHELASSVNY